ncbi:MAG: hypothetical protein HZB53_10275 [Chloroflexi bacterium]|nr:hypothetical protein [Chloroflexota bacterium]
MADYPIRGELRFRAETLQADTAFVHNHVGELSKPEQREVTGTQYVWAQFGASVEQWKALEAELSKRHIMAYLNEELTTIARAQKAEESYDRFLAQRRRRRVLIASGSILMFGGLLLFWVARIDQMVACSAFAVGVIVLALGRVSVKSLEEQYYDG